MSALTTPRSLNPFQRLMISWDQLAPYNAIHVLTVLGEIDPQRLQSAFQFCCDAIQLGAPHYSKHFDTVAFAPCPVQVIQTKADLEEVINRSLNQAFLPTELPLRLDLVSHASGHSYWVLTYSHWIADSYAIRSLLKNLVLRYFELGPAFELNSEPPPFERLYPEFQWQRVGWTFLQQVYAHLQQAKHLLRYPLPQPLNFKARYLSLPASSAFLTQTMALASQQGVTVNDIMIAAIGKALLLLTAEKRHHKRKKWGKARRDKIAIGTIVDIRQQATESLESIFGQYLSSSTVILGDEVGETFENCIRTVSAQTQAHKRFRQPVKSYALWSWAVWLLKWVRLPRQRAVMFHKNGPVLAGISNINLDNVVGLNSFADPTVQQCIQDYRRVSPTGPLLPLVFVITTYKQTLHIGVTYREAVYSHDEIQEILHTVTSLISPLSTQSPSNSKASCLESEQT